MEGPAEIAISLGRAQHDQQGILESERAIQKSCVFRTRPALMSFLHAVTGEEKPV